MADRVRDLMTEIARLERLTDSADVEKAIRRAQRELAQIRAEIEEEAAHGVRSHTPICCEDCCGSTFRLLWDGAVYCATCDEAKDGSYGRMADLTVVGDGGPDGPVGPLHLIYPHTCHGGTCAGCREELPGGIVERKA